jgi:hypothetical protein
MLKYTVPTENKTQPRHVLLRVMWPLDTYLASIIVFSKTICLYLCPENGCCMPAKDQSGFLKA